MLRHCAHTHMELLEKHICHVHP